MAVKTSTVREIWVRPILRALNSEHTVEHEIFVLAYLMNPDSPTLEIDPTTNAFVSIDKTTPGDLALEIGSTLPEARTEALRACFRTNESSADQLAAIVSESGHEAFDERWLYNVRRLHDSFATPAAVDPDAVDGPDDDEDDDDDEVTATSEKSSTPYLDSQAKAAAARKTTASKRVSTRK